MTKTCSICDKELTPVFDFPNAGCDSCMDRFIQYDDALVITFSGGYGMYFDDIDTGDIKAILCGDCANELEKVWPNLKVLLGREPLLGPKPKQSVRHLKRIK